MIHPAYVGCSALFIEGQTVNIVGYRFARYFRAWLDVVFKWPAGRPLISLVVRTPVLHGLRLFECTRV